MIHQMSEREFFLALKSGGIYVLRLAQVGRGRSVAKIILEKMGTMESPYTLSLQKMADQKTYGFIGTSRGSESIFFQLSPKAFQVEMTDDDVGSIYAPAPIHASQSEMTGKLTSSPYLATSDADAGCQWDMSVLSTIDNIAPFAGVFVIGEKKRGNVEWPGRPLKSSLQIVCSRGHSFSSSYDGRPPGLVVYQVWTTKYANHRASISC